MSNVDPQLDILVPHIGVEMNVLHEAPRKGLTELNGEPIMWKPNKPIKAALKFVGFYVAERSSSMSAILQSTTDKFERKYFCRSTDFAKLLKTTPAIAGVFVTEWKFRRCGRHIFILEA